MGIEREGLGYWVARSNLTLLASLMALLLEAIAMLCLVLMMLTAPAWGVWMFLGLAIVAGLTAAGITSWVWARVIQTGRELRALEREHTVEIDGLRVRPRVMEMILPYSHWTAMLARARQQDTDASR